MYRDASLGTVLLAASSLWLSAGCSSPGTRTNAGTRPDIILIVVDTLRPDALSWVAGGSTTPAIDALAREGARFPGAVSPAPLTLPAHVSLFTGLIPPHHGVRDNGHVLRDDVLTLAEVLRRQGYVTGAFVGGFPLRSIFGLDRGFHRYDDDLPVTGGRWHERPARETTRAALRWVSEAGARDHPLFLFVHYYEPHDPYTPPPEHVRSGPRGLYDGEVATVDGAVGDLVRGLASRSTGRERLTVFTSDHGESLGEHGEATHGYFVYDSTVLVPLVVHFPGRVAPRRSDAPVRLVDVAATVLDLAGIAESLGEDGRSFAPILRGEAFTPPPAYIESLQPYLAYGWAPLRGVRDSRFKLIEAPRSELFDLARDPGETTNRFADLGAEAEGLRHILASAGRDRGTSPSGRADGDTLEQLRALGYIGAGAQAPEPFATSRLADPKDRLAVRERLAMADVAVEQGQGTKAMAVFRRALEDEPDNRFALLRGGMALVRLGGLAEGIAYLERAVALDPGQPEALYALAEALSLAGHDARALERWRGVLHLQPRRAAAWSNMAAVLLRSGEERRALEALTRAAALAPGDGTVTDNLAEVRLIVARLEAHAGRQREAEALLELAIQNRPKLRQRAEKDPILGPLSSPRETTRP